MRSASLPSVIKAATPRKPAQLVRLEGPREETEGTEATVTFTNGGTETTEEERRRGTHS